MLRRPDRVRHDPLGEIHEYDSLASTQTLAAEAVRTGVRGILAIRAEHQDSGRGRQGGTWVDRPGESLLVTYLVPVTPGLGARHMAFAAGLACAETIQEVTGVRVGLKWPNDLEADGAKVGGVLVETVQGVGLYGIGLNANGRPPHSGSTTLSEVTGLQVSIGDLEPVLRRRLLGELTEPWDALLARWRRYDVTPGRRYSATTASGPVEAVAVGITDEGLLLLRAGDQEFATTNASAVRALLAEDRP